MDMAAFRYSRRVVLHTAVRAHWRHNFTGRSLDPANDTGGPCGSHGPGASEVRDFSSDAPRVRADDSARPSFPHSFHEAHNG